MRSIREFNVLPTHDASTNAAALQEAIDWASPRGAALYVEPSETPYPLAGGVVLRENVSLIGPHGPVGRGTNHPQRASPVGGVFAVTDTERPLLTVESATQLRGLQFWYPRQTLDNPEEIIAYPPTIRVAPDRSVYGVTLSSLTFYGEHTAFDFRASRRHPCEQLLFEHCYGYPLGGTFIAIDHCYDIPRLLHCHVNPSNRRLIDGGYSRSVVDRVVAQRTYTYDIDHTDNAQLLGAFTFGAYGGVRLGPATYGQLTHFNLDCVTVGIHKSGDSRKNRNWQIAQGSIIANTGREVAEVHPMIIDGQGHTAISNVEAFSGMNPALSTFEQSRDFLLVEGDQRPTVSMFGCRMRNYAADRPLTIRNPQAVIRAVACFDKDEQLFEWGSP